MKSVCQYCESEFERKAEKGPRPKWCSPACANAAYRRRKNPERFEDRKCVQCGDTFTPSIKNLTTQKTCSKACRDRLWYATNKASIDARTDAWHKSHKSRLSGYRKASHSKRPDHYKAARKIVENRRRARIKGNVSIPYTVAEWRGLVEKHGCRCLACKKHELEVGPMTVDHVIPVSLGGADALYNLQPLCFSCNASKNAKHIDYRVSA